MQSITPFVLLLSAGLLAAPTQAESPAVSERLAHWQQQGAGPFSATAGEALWRQQNEGRSCSSCHGKDLGQPGSHQRTGKAIDAMAPSANPKRLTDATFIEKWLKRNCKWTLGRECSAQEKGDLISWLSQQ